jgi:hypothetical protein
MVEVQFYFSLIETQVAQVRLPLQQGYGYFEDLMDCAQEKFQA